MPTFEDPAADAADAEQALRGLAHATRQLNDPAQIYSVLGSASQAVASLAQALHQIGSFHDRCGANATVSLGDPQQAGAAYRASWDLHRAAEMLTSVGKSIDSAHQAESTIVYKPRGLEAPAPAPVHGRGSGGLSL